MLTKQQTSSRAGEEPRGDDSALESGGEQPSGEPNFDAEAAIDGLDNEEDFHRVLFGTGGESTPDDSSGTGESEDDSSGEQPSGTSGEEPESESGDDSPQGSQTDANEGGNEEEEPAPAAPERIRLHSIEPEDRALIHEAVNLIRSRKAKNASEALRSLLGSDDARSAQRESKPTRQEESGDQGDDDEGNIRVGESEKDDEEEEDDDDDSDARRSRPSDSDPTVLRIRQELADLRAQRAQAAEDYERKAEIALTDQIEDKLSELQNAKLEANNRAREESRFAEQVQDSISRVKDLYPESDHEDSDFAQAMLDMMDLAAYRKDPVLQRPDYPEVLAKRVAKRLGTKTSEGKGAPPPPQPQNRARPLGEGATGRAAHQPQSREQISRLIEKADEDTLSSVLFGGSFDG